MHLKVVTFYYNYMHLDVISLLSFDYKSQYGLSTYVACTLPGCLKAHILRT
jgi:hypothetical protein